MAAVEDAPAATDPRPRGCTFSRPDYEALASLWHPVAYAHEVQGSKPLAVRLLDERLVVYRTSRGVTVAKDLCIHRGAELSRGWVEGDEIVCAYHGFRYEPAGACTAVPAQPNLPIPRGLCLKVHAAVERYGLIWTCLSGRPAVGLPDWPAYGAEGFRQGRLEPLRWATSAARHVENFNDVAHLSWVHVGTFGNRARPVVEPYQVTERNHVLHFRCPYEGRYFSDASGAFAPGTQWITYDFQLTVPFATQLVIEYADSPRRQYLWDIASPVSLRETRLYLQFALNFNAEVPLEEIAAASRRVFAEDQAMVESQHPEELPLDLAEEFHIRADRQATHYRQALQRLGLGREHTR